MSYISGTKGDDTLTGGTDADIIAGRKGDDTIDGGAGNDLIRGGKGDDTIDGGEGNDFISGGKGDDTIDGGEGDDFIRGGKGDDTIDGGEGNDFIGGGRGDDTVDGGAGDDLVRGGRGDDTLNGGAGDDVVRGGKGDDIAVYVIDENIGSTDFYSGGRDTDTLRLVLTAANFANADIQADIQAYLAHLDSGGNGDFQFTAFDLTVRKFEVLDIEVDGQSLDYLGNSSGGTFIGGADGETAIGGSGIDTIDGGGGDDLIYGGGGNDILEGGDGDDFVEGGDGDDLINGGAGDDTLIGDSGSGDDIINGGTGDDFLDGGAGNDTLNGDDGDDTLLGGEGNDILRGGAGRDSVQGGSGNDIIDSSGGSAASQSFGDIVQPGTGADTIIGHAGAYALDGGGLDLLYENLSGTGGLTITVGANGSGTAVSAVPGIVNDTFTYVDHVEGSQDADTLIGSNHTFESWVGEGGDDFIDGGGGADELAYRWEDGGGGVSVDLAAGTATDSYGDTDTITGIENIHGTLQADTLTGDAGANRLKGDDGDDTLNGGDGNDSLLGDAGNDTLNGGDGNDFLDGGEGDDILNGGAGDDTFWSGQGADSYDGGGLSFTNPREENNMIFLEDPAGVTVTFDASGTGSGGAIDGWGDADTFQFISRVHGSGFDDVIDASADNSDHFFVGHAGNDTIIGGAGFDKLSWVWEGQFFPGGGNGVVVDVGLGQATDTWGDTDTFSGIETFQGSLNDDIFNGAASDDRFEGMDGNDTLNGGDGDDFLRGDNGNDILRGGAGRDSVLGGSGDDIIDSSGGSAASQSFGDIIQPGTGADTIIGHAGAYALDGGGLDLLYENLSGTGGLTITVGASGSGTAVSASPGIVNDTFTYVDHVEGSQDADTLIGSNHTFESWVGEGGDDFIDGGGGTDELAYRWEDGGSGVTVDLGAGTATDSYGDTDTITGIENIHGTLQDDTLTGDAGTNRFRGDDGDDTLNGGDGGDFLRGDDGNDTLNGDDGNDFLRGDDGNDALRGGAGDDTIEGGAGRDFLDGGDGNDILNGGTGDDTFWSSQGGDSYDGGGLSFTNPREENGLIFLDDPAGVTMIFDASGTGSGAATDGWGDADTFQFISRIHGSGFDDLIDASADNGDHFFVGHAGNDTIIGGAGFDKLSWVWEGQFFPGGGNGVVVDVGLGQATDTWGDTDTFSGIETLQGSHNDDVFNGAASDDRFEGMDGMDQFNGAGGWDGVFYDQELNSGGSQGIDVDLLLGTGTDTFGAVDSFTGIEEIRGSNLADTIRGDNADNWLAGANGDDVLEGRGGNDGFEGGDGADTFILSPGDGSDWIEDFDFFEGDRIDVSAYAFANATTTDFFAPPVWDGVASTLFLSATDEVSLKGVDVNNLSFNPDDAFIWA